jgi:predicted Abi (CAAX) family protease
VTSTLLQGDCDPEEGCLVQGSGWQEDVSKAFPEGTRALVIHVYGGIGGNHAEAAAKTPLYFGHFAYGVAEVIRDPLTDDLRFDIAYHQVYTHNTDGIIAGTLHWSRFMGDRQFGWLGIRPTCDILIKLDAFTGEYEINGVKRSPLEILERQLEIMTARYRIGDGTGSTYVGPANNCAQDSNQAMYAAIKIIQSALEKNPELQAWLQRYPDEADRLKQLRHLGKLIKQELMPFGMARADWQEHTETLGTTLEESPLQQLLRGLISWRTLLPRLASDTITEIFLQQGASVWVLRTNQVGGHDPDIESIVPLTF